MKTRRIMVGVAATAALIPARPASAASPNDAEVDDGDVGEYCVTSMLSPEEIAAGVESPLTCWDTFADSLRAAGARNVPADLTWDELHRRHGNDPEVLALRSWLRTAASAQHLDQVSGGPDRVLTVSGPCLDGGGINLPDLPGWNNVINATKVLDCASVKHYDAANYGSGDTYTTHHITPETYQLMSAPLADDVSSIKYAT